MRTVIIGNSAAALSALESFRKYDKDSPVTIISKEGGNAYSRVLLPYYLRGKVDHDTFFIRTPEYYKEMNVTYLENEVVSMDHNQKIVQLNNGQTVEFDKLLIATGSSAINPPIKGLSGDGVYNMWTLEDIHNMEPLFKRGNRVLVLGSGFVALQAAWSATCKDLEVTIYELAPRIMSRVLDEKGAEELHKKIVGFNADVHLNVMTTEIERKENGTLVVKAKDKEPIEVDLIIVGTGVRSNMNFLQNTSVKTDRGVLVNEFMETNVKDIYAAGDVSQGLTAFDEKHVIHALWPTAIETGKIAGANMAGKKSEYIGSLNMNVTQLFEITVASMGKFYDEDGDEVWEQTDERGYIKMVLKEGIPIGATIAGKSELVKYLGALRPLIRKKKKLACAPKDIIKSFHLNVASSID